MLLRLSVVASTIVLAAGCAMAPLGTGGAPAANNILPGKAVIPDSCTDECWQPKTVKLKVNQTKYATAYLSNQTYYGGYFNNSCSSSVQAMPAADPKRESGIWVWKWSITAKAKGPYHCKLTFGASVSGALVTLHIKLKR